MTTLYQPIEIQEIMTMTSKPHGDNFRSNFRKSQYFVRLNPWVISKLVNNNLLVIARFRSYADAISHLNILERRFGSSAQFVINYETRSYDNN